MQDVGIGGARLTAVSRSQEGIVHLEFHGLSTARHVKDKATRLQISMSIERAANLVAQLKATLDQEPPALV